MSKAVSAKIKPRAAAPGPQQQARTYIDAGLRVMPISMPKASPAVPAGWYGRDKPDACAEPNAFKPTQHVGILCGRLGGQAGAYWELCGLDRDGDAEWADLERALGYELPPTLSSKGDRHRYYWLPVGHGIRQVNGLVRQIDLRSDHGGYMREPWEWDQPFDLAAISELDTDTVEALRVLRGMHDSPDGGYASDLPAPAPLDDDAAEALIAAAVEEWPAAGQGRHTCSMALGGALRRAGVDRDSAEAIARAVVETVQSPPQRLAAALDAWERADRGEPAYGEHTLSQTLLDGGPKTLEAFAAVKRPDPVVDSIVARWEQRRAQANAPEPAKAPSGPAAPSDAEALACLPSWVRAHVLAAQEEMRTPLSLNLANALGALGCAVSGRVQVKVHSSYTHHTCLFVCTVADPGELKSAAFNRAMQPITAWEAERIREDSSRYLEAVSVRADMAQRAKDLQDDRKRGYGKGEELPPPPPALLSLQLKLADPEPVPFRAVVGDVTSEKLADMLAQHGSLLCLSSDAGKIFSVLGGQYSGGGADLSVWLEAYDGRSAPVDRMGRQAERPRHDRTTLACALSTQFSVIEQVASNPAMSGQGFIQRFCLVVCDSAERRWAPGERVQPMPGDVAKAYGEGLDAMLALPSGVIAELSPEAEEMYIRWRDELESRKGTDLGGELRGWASKHLERTSRIAGALWAADGAQGLITGAQFGAAVTWGRWLVPHAIRVLVGDTDQADDVLIACVAKQYARLHRPVTVRDYKNFLPRSLRRKAKERDERVANLVALGRLIQVGKGLVPA